MFVIIFSNPNADKPFPVVLAIKHDVPKAELETAILFRKELLPKAQLEPVVVLNRNAPAPKPQLSFAVLFPARHSKPKPHKFVPLVFADRHKYPIPVFPSALLSNRQLLPNAHILFPIRLFCNDEIP